LPIITMTTDFGEGPFAGLMKGVIWGINPEARIVDLTHKVPPQDVRAGALVLEQARKVFEPGSIHLAVVDPGVGSERRAICARALGMYFVGPDNGLFTQALDLDPECEVRLLLNKAFFRKEISNTFHGRDIFAPVAAHLAGGADFRELGPVVKDPVLLDWPRPFQKDARLAGCILCEDSFGNLVSNLDQDTVETFLKGRTGLVSMAGLVLRGISKNYSDTSPGGIVALFNSTGYLELAVNRGNLRKKLGLDSSRIYGVPVSVSAFNSKH
jgi:hypothetical protein